MSWKEVKLFSTIIIAGLVSSSLGEVCVGQKGIRGPEGLDGPRGFLGRDGLDGVSGSDGLPGAKGEPGEPGGGDCIVGKGEKGRPGYDGIRGMKGLPGPKGEKGEIGESGDSALSDEACREFAKDQKMRGEIGDYGLPGKPGGNGLPGRPGLPGMIGPPGPKGDIGPFGLDGFPGLKGERGLPGQVGPPGLPRTDCSKTRSKRSISAKYVISVMVKHSQRSSVPECGKYGKKLWEGYSLVGVQTEYGVNYYNDLGSSGSCVPKFSLDAFGSFETNASGPSTWIASVTESKSAASFSENISRCVVCESIVHALALHGSPVEAPDCPEGWEILWQGFSIAEPTGRMSSTGSCLDTFTTSPLVDCNKYGKRDCHTSLWSPWFTGIGNLADDPPFRCTVCAKTST